MFLLKILLSIILTILAVIKNPIYWIAMTIVFVQYIRVKKVEKRILGINKESIYMTVFKSSMWGIVGGLIGSIILIFFGITVEFDNFQYILILSIILMLIHPRFVCFSYAGGIISLLNIFTGFPDINVSSVLAIVAILHLIESFLILIDGDSSKVPIFVERRNKVVGGFNMYKFWPIPFIVFVLVTQDVDRFGLQPTSWWPIFKTMNAEYVFQNNSFGKMSYLFMGVIAALGYGDIAVTEFPKKKIKKSAKNLFIFSCTLLVLAIISTYLSIFKFIAAVFTPLAHEIIIETSKKREIEGKPVFTSVKKGIRVLDIMQKSPAQKMGIESGDIILLINGFRVNKKEDIKNILNIRPKEISIRYINKSGKVISKKFKSDRKGINSLGALLIPNDCNYSFIVEEMKSPILVIFKKIKNIL